ncbi:LysR family transcriptional regulator [Paraburkholderia caribensis]|uniref:LysR family transcriptional regulator n=1 Tax=Paraburkholderia caribensis TaxID=75105 RepID=UPI0007C63492|nr:LysR family transcriptional regulator [Paraburkholderia caribensis]
MRTDHLSIRLFVAVVEESSISRAAEREHIALSAASRRISELEDTLGAKLLYRTTGGVYPTPAGQAVLRRARNILREMQEMETEVSTYGDGHRGLVRIAANISSLMQFLPERVATFKARFPFVEVNIKETTSAEAVKAVHDGQVDVALASSSTGAEGLAKFSCWDDELVLVVPAGHTLAESEGVTCLQALEYEFVTLQYGGSIESQIRKFAQEAGKSLIAAVTVSSFDPMARMVSAGVGVGVMPKGVAIQLQQILNFTYVPLLESWSSRQLQMFSKPSDELTATASLFVALLKERGLANDGC